MDQVEPNAPRRAPSLARELDFRPLVLPACAFIIGILLHEVFPALAAAAFVAAALLTVAVPLIYFLTSRQALLIACVVLLCMSAGFLHHAAVNDFLPADDVSRLVPPEGALVRVRGVISTRPRYNLSRADDTFQQRNFERTRFQLDVDEALTVAGWEPASGVVQVNVYDRADDFAYGDRIEFVARFARPRSPSSDVEFDYRKFLLRHGVRLRASVESRAALGPVIEFHRGNFLMEIAHSLGARLARVINRYHDPERAGLLHCILLGERGAVDEETERSFRLSGLSHLLTVSGLHVMVLVGGLWLLLRFLLAPERAIALVVIVAALLFAGMAGLQPSVVRAVVVTVIFALGVLISRRHDMVNALAAAALILLVRNPNEIFFAGFQLSFVSVLGLVGLSPAVYRFLRPRLGLRGLERVAGAHHWLRVKADGFFVGTLAITGAAWLASQPLVAWHFGVLNPATILINVLLMPLFSVVLLTGFVVLLVETFIGGMFIASISDALAWLMITLGETSSHLPGAWVNFARPNAWLLVGYYAALLLAAVGPSLGVRRKRAAAFALAMLCAMAGAELWPSAPDAAELVVLDVGQGSASLVLSAGGRAALVDVGAYGSSDVTRWTVLPYLVRRRVRALDVVLLSHADTDHTSGLPRLVENFCVKKVLLGEDFKHTAAGLRVERWLIDHRVPHAFVRAGDAFDLGDVRMAVIHPPDDLALMRNWSSNGRSAVVRGSTPGGTFILFADAAGHGFTYLAQHNDLAADVVLAAHHGGYSGMEQVADELRWPVVLFSAGRGFVGEDKLAAYRRGGGRIFNTADDGTLTVRFGEKIEVDASRRR